VPSKSVFCSAPPVLVCLFSHLRIFCERKENITDTDSVIAAKCVEISCYLSNWLLSSKLVVICVVLCIICV